MTGAVRRPRMRVLPGVVAGVALLITDGGPASASCPAQCLSPASWSDPFSFAGFTWERKNGCGGPGPNCWAPANAVLDAAGVHLRLTRQGGSWYAAEIRTTTPVPIGSYSVQLVGRTDLLDPNVVLGVFLYDDAAGETSEPCPSELDLESSRFGDPAAPNGHFVSYASGVCGPADLDDFSYILTGTYTTHQIDWAPGAVAYRLMHGHRTAPDLPEHLIGERSFVSPLVPGSGGMRLHLNLWAFAGSAPTDQQEVEVVISDVVRASPALAVEAPPGATVLAIAARQNPSRGGVDFQLELPADGRACVTILDVTGRRVATLADAIFPSGRHRLRWAPAPVTAGVYFARLEAGGRMITRRVVLFD